MPAIGAGTGGGGFLNGLPGAGFPAMRRQDLQYRRLVKGSTRR
jgi:hypothetical protein